MTKTMLEPGTYIDSHWGHYQSARIVELARSLGWQPKPYDDRTDEQEAAYVDSLAVTYLELGTLGDTEYEGWYDIVQEAEDYINENHTTECHWFGYHADIGDVGVWPTDNYEAHEWEETLPSQPGQLPGGVCTRCGVHTTDLSE